ncbi:MAG: RbsD/FucU domain-containing protein [Pseudomonadota bacterium]
MLKGIDPRLNADVLYVLRAMGHGDTVVICDTNFPADSIARETQLGDLVRIDNVPAAGAIEAIASVLPVEDAARMEVMGAPDEIPAIQADVQAVLDKVDAELGPMRGIERFAFYEEARQAYAVIATGERQFYGCFILTKGVIPPDA